MTDEVVTKLTIDGDVAGGEAFGRAMDAAGDAASRATANVGNMTLAIAGVGVGVVGALAALRGFVDFVGNQSQQLVDFADHAAIAGMSAKQFQETLFAARSAGLSDKDFASGLDKISDDLLRASQSATEFGKLFEANGLSIRDVNGQLKSSQVALTDIMSLMQNAAPEVQRRIAAIAGVSQSWIPFLKEGADAFELQKQKAQDLGVIISQDIINQATIFNTQWKEAVAIWDLQFKASISSIMPLLTQMATMASQIISAIGAVTGSVIRWQTPDQDKTKAQLNDQINDAYRLREALEGLGDDIGKNTFSGLKARNLAGLLGLPEDANIAQVDQLIDKLAALYDKPERLRVTPNPSTTVLPNMNGKDDIDRTTEAIERQIGKMQADAAAVGKGAGEMERLRVEAQLYEAAQRAGVTDTSKYAEQFHNLADRAAQAADQLERSKVVAGAFSAIGNSLTEGLTDIATGSKKAGDAFRDMGMQIIKAIDEMIIKLVIVQPLMKAIGFGVGDITGGLFGSSPVKSAHGNVFDAGKVVPFAYGGIPDMVDSPTMAPMALFGEAGPEAIMPLKRGPDGSLGVASAGGGRGGDTHTYYIDAKGADQAAIARLQRALVSLSARQGKQEAATVSVQRFNATGVY